MIYIDNVIFYLQNAGGVSVVWKEFISRLCKDRIKNVAYLNYNRENANIFYKCLLIPAKNIIHLKLYILSIQRYLPIRLPHIKEKFIFHSSYYRYSSNPNAINITTVHDFTYEYFVNNVFAKLHIWQKYKAIRKSKYIICISENTKKDLLKFLPDIDPLKIRVIYNGVSNDYHPLLINEVSSYTFLDEKYILFVGARGKYKNFKFVVESLSHYTYKLVIVGVDLSVSETKFLNKTIGKNSYIFLGKISNEKLNLLYNYAFAFFYPSSYEGFGIPILEAQRAGCPVVAYNSSSIPEVIGETPLLLQSLTLEEVDRCFSLLEKTKMRELIKVKGYENAKKFSWDKMYKQILKLYEEALETSI